MKSTSLNKCIGTCSLAVLLLYGFVGSRALAANEAISSVSGSIDFSMTNLTFGYSFTVGSQAVSVSSLGVYDTSPGAVGLTMSHDVGLWDNSGTLLGSVTIPSGNSATLSAAGFRYESISGGPVVLAANTTYRLGAQYNVDDTDMGLSSAAITVGPDISYGTAYEAFSFTLAFPNLGIPSADPGFFGPNAEYTLVPEPRAGLVLGLGLAALTLGRRRWMVRSHSSRASARS
jgi:hypothetical protein